MMFVIDLVKTLASMAPENTRQLIMGKRYRHFFLVVLSDSFLLAINEDRHKIFKKKYQISAKSDHCLRSELPLSYQ